MDDVALANYVTGTYFGYVEAGRLDPDGARLLGVKPHVEIWFSDYTLLKLQKRHGDINFSHYRHMPSLLLHGFRAQGRTPNVLDAWWVSFDGREFIGFFAALKATKKGEVFVATFHRIHLNEARRLWKRALRDGRLVREQALASTLLKPGTDHLKPKKKMA
jgi:hypothetical protein